jgi:hypothetical protein
MRFQQFQGQAHTTSIIPDFNLGLSALGKTLLVHKIIRQNPRYQHYLYDTRHILISWLMMIFG